MHVDESVTIARPPAEVFALLADLERAPEWQPSLERLEVASDGATHVGTSGTEVRRGGGRRIESRFEVTELDPERRLAIHTKSSSVEAWVGFDLDADGDGTRVRMQLDVRLRGALRFMEGALRGRAQEQSRGDLQRLKRLAETGSA